LVFGAALGLALTVFVSEALADDGCQDGESPHLAGGFADLYAQLTDAGLASAVGSLTTCVYADPKGTGNTQQDTTGDGQGGEFYWLNASNTNVYSDGYDRWALTPAGLVHWESETLLEPPPEAEVVRTRVSDPPDDSAQRAPSQPAYPLIGLPLFLVVGVGLLLVVCFPVRRLAVAGTHYVRAYRRRDGTYVRSHYRSRW
jgi:hypothetical protein